MLTNDLTKLTRWIVPGWMTILAFYGFIIIDIVFYVPSNIPPMYNSLTQFLTTINPVNNILDTVFLAAIGVPLGFSIYQLYELLRPIELLPPILPGHRMALEQIQKDIRDIELALGINWRKKWINNPLFQQDHRFRLRYQELLFLEAVRDIDSSGAGPIGFHDRYLYLHEMIHTLGASILGIYFGFIGYTFLKLRISDLQLADYLFIIFIIMGIFYFLVNFEYAKKAAVNDREGEGFDDGSIPTFRFVFPIKLPVIYPLPQAIKWERREVKIVAPAAMYVFILMLMHLWVNPSFSVAGKSLNEWTLLIRILLSLIFIVSWYNSKKEHSSASKLGDAVVLGLSFLVIIILARVNSFINWVDWPFFTALVLFLLANMALLFNRQNFKEQSFDLQYYVVKKYLEEQ